jgi:hypothetical protein
MNSYSQGPTLRGPELLYGLSFMKVNRRNEGAHRRAEPAGSNYILHHQSIEIKRIIFLRIPDI